MEFLEYVCIVINPGTDLKELENHLSMNGYNFGLDKNSNLLFVCIDEINYVQTILADRHIAYYVKTY